MLSSWTFPIISVKIFFWVVVWHLNMIQIIFNQEIKSFDVLNLLRYGIYSAEELYLINQQMSHIEPMLDELYPKQLRPIKGLLYTYFSNKLAKANRSQELDLQDNELCRSIIVYLNKAFQALGKNLYVDILFNDINSDQYFEIYSEFNLKRLQLQIEDMKMKLFPVQHLTTTNGKTSNNSQTKTG